jgi:hypothetical protein
MRTCEIQIIEGCCIDFLKKNSIHFMSRGHHDTKYSRLPDINRNVPTKSSCGTYFNLASDITTNRLLLKMK